MSFDSLLSDLEDDLKAAFTALMSNILNNGGRTLMAIAAQAVTAVANDPSLLTSSAKREAAMASTIQALIGAGLPVATSAVAAAIEAAVSSMQSHSSSATTAVNLSPTDALASLAHAAPGILAIAEASKPKPQPEGPKGAVARVTRKNT